MKIENINDCNKFIQFLKEGNPELTQKEKSYYISFPFHDKKNNKIQLVYNNNKGTIYKLFTDINNGKCEIATLTQSELLKYIWKKRIAINNLIKYSYL